MMETQFAYGSNMDSDRLKQKGIERILENAKIARLDDWEFGFTKKGKDGGKANIIPKTGSIVWGLLLELDPDAVEEMDRSEGTKANIPHYTKETIRVITDDGVEHECKTYVANFHPDRFDEEGVPPSEEYLKHIVDGATIHNLPPKYIEGIGNTITID
jgi:gamma-glutamylcyclotransferase (GGCT)/AIG2-like uncharacterized protein YtfP